MTTMELEAKKAFLVRDILTEVDDMDFLKKLQQAFEQLKKQMKKEEKDQYISKKEILAGIDAGLKDMKAGKTTPARDFLKELKDEI